MTPIAPVRQWIMERLTEYASYCEAFGLARPTVYEWYPSEVPFDRFPIVMVGKLQSSLVSLALPELFEQRHVYSVVGAVYSPDPRESILQQEWYADLWLDYVHQHPHRFRMHASEFYTSDTWTPQVTMTPVYIQEHPLHGWSCEVMVTRIVRGGTRGDGS